MKTQPLKIRNTTIYPGETITAAIPLPEIYSNIPAFLPVNILHGKKPGPTLLVCAAVHGDEITGTEIVHSLTAKIKIEKLCGTLITIPVVNVYGLMNRERNTPGGRDICKQFPGSPHGSIASRIAYIISSEILKMADYCIDLHSGRLNHYSYPQVHCNFNKEENKALAEAFNIPIVINIDNEVKGSLRSNSESQNIPCMSFETGEALRFDKLSVRTGVKGILNIMQELQMFANSKKLKPINFIDKVIINSIKIIRTPSSGLLTFKKRMGKFVKKGELIASVADPFGSHNICNISAPVDGILINEYKVPLINEGEFIFSLGCFEHDKNIAEHISEWQESTEHI